MNTDEPLPTRASLLDRLKDASNHASWEEFQRIYRGLLVGVARRAGLNEHEADEAVQETLIAVAKKMPQFRYDPGRDSFKGWLLRIVRWKIVDQVRRRRQAPSQSEEEGPPSIAERLVFREDWQLDPVSLPADTADPRQDFDAIWEAEWEHHLVTKALVRVKRLARPEHYAIYHLHVIEERPVAEVCRTLRVSTAAVYLAKHRVGNLVKKAVRQLRTGESW